MKINENPKSRHSQFMVATHLLFTITMVYQDEDKNDNG